MTQQRKFSTASRKEIDITLQVIEGKIPEDMYGYVFLNSAAGTVNSNGLPFPEMNPDNTPNQEFGSAMINGDGMMYRFDFSLPGKIGVKTGLFRTPCYYADEATKWGTEKHHTLGFKNMGLARISSALGTRNELNTAIAPVRVPGEDKIRLLATFDAGRAFEFDPETLELITPIGENKIWAAGLPPEMDQPIAMVLTTAHPVFDPETRELYTVNFTKNDELLMMSTRIFKVLFTDMNWLEQEMLKWIRAIGHLDHKAIQKDLSRFVSHVHHHAPSKNTSWWKKIWNEIKYTVDKFIYKDVSNRNAVKVLKWVGQKDLQEWQIVDEKGEPIGIEHNMHQIGLSRDFLVLGDTNFKFTLDVMLNYPFPHNEEIDKFLRGFLGGAMNDYSTIYLVKRSDLRQGVDKVKAAKVVLPVETVHFSANYENPDNMVTIHTAHNCAACPAEWIRSYDTRVTEPGEPIDLEKLGLISVGELDIGKIGKIVVNGNTGELNIEKTKYLFLPGKPGEKDPGPHTWGVGLYTFRDMLSPLENVNTIEHIYWQSYGLRKDMLTKYIYDLYKDPKRHREYSVDEVVDFTRKEAPFVLSCVATDQLNVIDYYTFDFNTYMWSLQFVPRNGQDKDIPPSRNGYILCTMIIGTETPEGISYLPEIWLFDAAALAKGPVCRLNNPDLSFGFTIHSVWVPEAGKVNLPPYKLDIKPDYDYMISKIKKPELRSEVQELFNVNVYPHFK